MDSPFIGTELFETLLAQAGPQWLQAQDHAFVHALGSGELARDRFEFFLKQDYVYLIAYSRAWAVATAKAPELGLLEVGAGLVSDTLELEMQLHRDYCAEFGIGADELAATEAAPVTQAYSDFGLAVAHQGGLLDLLVALAPCGVGYAEIGARYMPEMGFSNGMSTHPYKKWIEIYSGAEFQRYATWIADTVNYLGAGLIPSASAATALRARRAARDLQETPRGGEEMPEGEEGALEHESGPTLAGVEAELEISLPELSYAEQRVAQLARLMTLGCRYEWLFWDMAWKMEGWAV
jgi:thiaminase/transcriptional activator TenA